MQPRILFISTLTATDRGGREQHTAALMRSLLTHDWQVAQITTNTHLAATDAAIATSTRWRLGGTRFDGGTMRLFFLCAWSVPVSFFCALWYRWRYQVRVVYCVALPEKLVFTPFARLFGMRVIWAQHRHPSPKLKSWLVRLVYRRSGRMATIVCVSRSVAQDVLAMGIPRQRTRVIHPGIDLDTVAAIAPEQIMYFQKKFVIGSMSRLRPGKGIEYLLQAFAAVRETVPDAQLVILGEGEHRQQLEWLAQRLGVSPAVHFAGFVPDFYPWLLGMDVYVLPPVEPEAAGLSVLQAMASGAAVVATDVGGLSEIIVPGETGVLVPPADVDALVEALLSLYHHRAEREEMTQLARRSVITRYTASRMLEEYREVLEG